MDFKERETSFVVDLFSQLSVTAIRTDETGDRDQSGISKEFGDLCDAADILSPIVLSETQITVESVTDVIPVQNISNLVLVDEFSF